MKNILRLMLVSILIMGVIPVVGFSLDIQALIDEAEPGDIISIPAGTYRVNLTLKEGVILEGAGADQTILDGGGIGPVVVGEDESIIKGFSIINGIEGVKTAGRFMGVFENIITANKGSGIRSGGGDCVIVNNIISSNLGPAGIDAARSYVWAFNNTICNHQSGLLFWKSPRSIFTNNVVAFSRAGSSRDEESEPEIFNNIFWGNNEDFIPFQPDDDNFYLDPLIFTESGICRISEGTPAAELGMPVDGIPEELTGGIGCRLEADISLDEYRLIMDRVREGILTEKPMVTYELLESVGSFRVTTSFPKPDFMVTSSSVSTRIEEIEAYDSTNLDSLFDELIDDDPPAVEVRSWEGVDYPTQADRYVMDSTFVKPESYFFNQEGELKFLRQTNFARIQIIIPENYVLTYNESEIELDEDQGIISVLNPKQDLIDLNLTFSAE